MHLLLKALTRTPLPLLYAWIACFVAFRVLQWRRAYMERDIANAFPDGGAPASWPR